jgi:hypothetical protein
MKRSQIIIITCLIAVFGTAVTFAQTFSSEGSFSNIDYVKSFFRVSDASKKTTPDLISDIQTKLKQEKPANPESSEKSEIGESSATISDPVFYDILFNTVKMLDHEAKKMSQEGKDGKIWSGYFESQIGLTRDEVAILRLVADEFALEIEPVQVRAMQIIKERRDAFQKKQEIPLPSKELGLLQNQRNEIAIKYRDRLQTEFAGLDFEHFNNNIRQNFSKNLRALDNIREVLDKTAERLSSDEIQLSDATNGGGNQ